MDLTAVRALSLWRPWPGFILYAGKDIENRSWSTPYRGPLILHAGSTLQPVDGATDPLLLHQGFVGVADLVGVHHSADCGACCSDWAAFDSFHWELRDPRPFPTPTAGPGRQRLFRPSQNALNALVALG